MEKNNKKNENKEIKEKIEAASLELEQAQEKERLAHDEAVEAEEKAKMQGCKIWEYGAWQKNEEGQIVSLLNTPNDIAVDNEGNIYIADTNNYRVVKMDRDCNLIWEFTKPMDATFDQSIDFLPKKIVVDIAGRVYVLVTNVNKGIVKYDTDMTFTGFIGANKVTVSTSLLVKSARGISPETEEVSVAIDESASLPCVVVYSNSGAKLYLSVGSWKSLNKKVAKVKGKNVYRLA